MNEQELTQLGELMIGLLCAQSDLVIGCLHKEEDIPQRLDRRDAFEARIFDYVERLIGDARPHSEPVINWTRTERWGRLVCRPAAPSREQVISAKGQAYNLFMDELASLRHQRAVMGFYPGETEQQVDWLEVQITKLGRELKQLREGKVDA